VASQDKLNVQKVPCIVFLFTLLHLNPSDFAIICQQIVATQWCKSLNLLPPVPPVPPVLPVPPVPPVPPVLPVPPVPPVPPVLPVPPVPPVPPVEPVPVHRRKR